MKIYFKILLVIVFLFSCKKEPITSPTPPTTQNEVASDWRDDYDNGGDVDLNVNNNNNPLVGTKWVLEKMVANFATEYPNDTITFLSDNRYNINNGGSRSYALSTIPSSTNYELTLNFFFPFGGSHYSANVGYFFVEDGFMENTEFTNIQNTTTKVVAWFKKI